MKVRIDSGEVPQAEGLANGDLNRCVTKWQEEAYAWCQTPERLLDIIDQVERLRLWERQEYRPWKCHSRDEFLEIGRAHV